MASTCPAEGVLQHKTRSHVDRCSRLWTCVGTRNRSFGKQRADCPVRAGCVVQQHRAHDLVQILSCSSLFGEDIGCHALCWIPFFTPGAATSNSSNLMQMQHMGAPVHTWGSQAGVAFQPRMAPSIKLACYQHETGPPSATRTCYYRTSPSCSSAQAPRFPHPHSLRQHI